MRTFSVPVHRVASVEDYPNYDRMSIIKLENLTYAGIGFSLQSDDGRHRFKVGDLCVMIGSASVLPEWVLKDMGLWDEDTNKAVDLREPSVGIRVIPLQLGGEFREGVLYPTFVEVVCATELDSVPSTFGQRDNIAQHEMVITVHRFAKLKQEAIDWMKAKEE